MNFLNPALLIGLSAILIPIVLHFLYKKRIIMLDFSSIYFLKKIQKNKINKITWLEWLILLLRILTIACIVIAFSNPISTHLFPLSLPSKLSHFIVVDQTIINQASYKDKTLINYLNESIGEFKNSISDEDDIYLTNAYNYDVIKSSKIKLSADIASLEMNKRAQIEPQKIIQKIYRFAQDEDISQYFSYIFTPIQFKDTIPQVHFKTYYPNDIKLRNNRIENASIVQKSITSVTPLTLNTQLILSENTAQTKLTTIVNNETVDQRTITKSGKYDIPIGKFPVGNYEIELLLSDRDDFLPDNTFFTNFTRYEDRHILILTESEDSYLSNAFLNLPDSSIHIKIDRTQNILAYPLSNYQTVFWEGNVPVGPAQDNIIRAIRSNQTNFIFIPSPTFDYNTWNISKLKLFFSFAEPNGNLNKESTKIRFNKADISDVLLPNIELFKKDNDDIFYVNYFFKEKFKESNLYIGNKSHRLFVKNKEYKMYFFLFPFSDLATTFIFDSRFIPILYHLIYLEDEKLKLNHDELLISDYINEPTLIASGKKQFGLNHINSNAVLSKYTIPDDMVPGNYKIKTNDSEYIMSFNDETFKNHVFAKYDDRQIDYYDSNTVNHHWRFFLLLALIFYILELLIGRGKLI